MSILKNKEIRNILIICLIIIIIAGVSIKITTSIQIKNYKNQVNYTIANIIGLIQEKYPTISEEEIIKLLANKNNFSKGKEILEKYGINNEVSAVYVLQSQEKDIMRTNISIVITALLLILLVFGIYLKYRQKKLDELSKYIKRIINKDYSLNIEENTEDELNHLKNELYKVTIMLKEEAENANKQKEALSISVSDISHQLKTPLTSIMILLDNLNESDNMSEETRKKFIREISNQIEGMKWLVISLLKISRLDAGVVEFSKKDINVNDLINEIISNLEILAEVKDVKLQIDSEKQTFIKGDYNWNKEAIQNIIKNAIEHTKEESKIIISISENSIYTQIKIKDEGNGISKKDIKHIFERFYKAENSSENSIGIGLAISKTIIEQQNGYISVDSIEGQGTTFTIKYMK